MNREEIKIVVSILKKRFGNLAVEETVDLALQIIEALEQTAAKRRHEEKDQS